MDTNWKNNPTESFNSFIRSSEFLKTGGSRSSNWQLNDKSIAVYSFMFGRFVRWLMKNQIHIHDVTSTNIVCFINSLNETTKSEIRWRYVRLLERTFSFLVLQNVVKANPVTSFLLENEQQGRVGVSGKNAEMCTISEEDKCRIKALIAKLSDSIKSKDIRDAALCSILLGSGLKLSEALLLEKCDVHYQKGVPYLNISKTGLSGRRVIQLNELIDFDILMPFLRWVEAAGEGLLFKGTSNNASMSAATAYRRIRSVLDRCGVEMNHKGGRGLRNSFAIFHIKSGVPKGDLCYLMGLRELKSLNIYESKVRSSRARL